MLGLEFQHTWLKNMKILSCLKCWEKEWRCQASIGCKPVWYQLHHAPIDEQCREQIKFNNFVIMSDCLIKVKSSSRISPVCPPIVILYGVLIYIFKKKTITLPCRVNWGFVIISWQISINFICLEKESTHRNPVEIVKSTKKKQYLESLSHLH